VGRDFCWHLGRQLDLDAMRAAAPALVGEHDFAAFAGALEEPEASTVRRVEAFEVRREHTRIVIEVTANAFLPHQVRRMAGALVQVGLGRLGPAAYGALLEGPPSSAGPAAPARGLFLVSVEYEADPFA
jgi:tRNA pseudouridine38-40 synthase